jgi:hypothetical protein
MVIKCPKCHEEYNHCKEVFVVTGDDNGNCYQRVRVAEKNISISSEVNDRPIGTRQRDEPGIVMDMECEYCGPWFLTIHHRKGMQIFKQGVCDFDGEGERVE